MSRNANRVAGVAARDAVRSDDLAGCGSRSFNSRSRGLNKAPPCPAELLFVLEKRYDAQGTYFEVKFRNSASPISPAVSPDELLDFERFRRRMIEEIGVLLARRTQEQWLVIVRDALKRAKDYA